MINITSLKCYAKQWQAGVQSLQNAGFYMFGIDGESLRDDERGAEAHEVGTHLLHGFVS